MRIRDSYATLSKDETEYDMPSGGVQIIADDGRTLFDIALTGDNSIQVSVGGVCKSGGQTWDSGILLKPVASNTVKIYRPPFQEDGKDYD